ncbi:MAG: sugar phosphate isomerase/epimerase [Clostridia bacterium]|nr:sugar phosphate isomerase/epimerase [Clostridia bacterium]
MNENKYNLGLVSVSFRKHTPTEILEAMTSAGLSQIEWGSDVHAPCDDQEKLTQIAALQKEYGVCCSSYGTYFRLGETPIEKLTQYIDAAKILGTRILRLWCGNKSGADMTAEERAALLTQCKSAAAIAEENDVILCMECHKMTFTERLEDTLTLMETVNSPCFRMYWQPFQWQEAKENEVIARAIAPYCEHIHVFHWKGTQRFSLNDGIDEWRAYLKPFSAPRTLLLEFMPDDMLSSLSTEAAALRIIAEH